MNLKLKCKILRLRCITFCLNGIEWIYHNKKAFLEILKTCIVLDFKLNNSLLNTTFAL